MVKVVRHRDRNTGEFESLDLTLRRFKKAVQKADVIKDWKKHEFFMKKSLKLKKKSEEHQKLLKAKMRKNQKSAQRLAKKRKAQRV